MAQPFGQTRLVVLPVCQGRQCLKAKVGDLCFTSRGCNEISLDIIRMNGISWNIIGISLDRMECNGSWWDIMNIVECSMLFSSNGLSFTSSKWWIRFTCIPVESRLIHRHNSKTFPIYPNSLFGEYRQACPNKGFVSSWVHHMNNPPCQNA